MVVNYFSFLYFLYFKKFIQYAIFYINNKHYFIITHSITQRNSFYEFCSIILRFIYVYLIDFLLLFTLVYIQSDCSFWLVLIDTYFPGIIINNSVSLLKMSQLAHWSMRLVTLFIIALFINTIIHTSESLASKPFIKGDISPTLFTVWWTIRAYI